MTVSDPYPNLRPAKEYDLMIRDAHESLREILTRFEVLHPDLIGQLLLLSELTASVAELKGAALEREANV